MPTLPLRRPVAPLTLLVAASMTTGLPTAPICAADEDDPCGACCFDDGFCIDVAGYTEQLCDLSGGTWSSGVACNSTACAPYDSPKCCVNGICLAYVENLCEASGGVFIGDAPCCECLGASFITVAVHGQVPDAFYSSSWSAPAWIYDLPNALELKADAVYDLRRDANLPRFQFDGLTVDWAQLTGDGAKSIAGSRALFILGSVAGSPTWSIPAYAAGAQLERWGRAETSRASRRAANATFVGIRNRLQLIRDASGGTHPIFLEFVAHSRGTTVTSRIVNRLVSSPAAMGPLEVNIVYLDAIDSHPSEPDLLRPRALSGHLLGDPLVERHANERIHQIFAQCAAICATTNCAAVPGSWFPSEWLCEWENAGVVITDEFLRTHGMPRGRSRGYLGPEAEFTCPGSTHASVLADFVQTAQFQPVGQPSAVACSTRYSERTRFGALVADPEMPLPTPVPFLGGGPTPLPNAGTEAALVEDPDFDALGAFLDAVDDLLADPEFQTTLTPAFDDVRTLLECSQAAGFPDAGPWRSSVGTPAVVVDDLQTAVRLDANSAIEQSLDPASVDVVDFELRLTLELLEPDGHLDATLIGARLDGAWTFDAADGLAVGEPTAVVATVTRTGAADPDVDDVLTLGGEAVLVHAADVVPVVAVPCPADVNADGTVGFDDLLAILVAWGPCPDCAADVDGDGLVGFDDLLAMLVDWGPCGT